MYEFKLPDLGEGIHEGEILQWYVKPGQIINEDDPLVEIETDKAAVTIPSPKGGKVLAVNGGVGDVIAVGKVLVQIDDGSTAAPDASKPVQAPPASSSPPERAASPAATAIAPASPPEVASTATAPQATTVPERRGPIPAAPATRRLARELNVDLRLVPPSGPGGRVTIEDVQRTAQGVGSVEPPSRSPAASILPATDEAEAEVAPVVAAIPGGATIPYLEIEVLPDFSQWGPVETEPVRSIRRKVARRMVTSMTLVPHVVHVDEADVTELDALRKAQKSRLADQPGGKLSLLPFIVRAVTRCLKEFPMFNASLDPHRELLVYKKYYNIGFAADTPRGLIVPVVKGADALSVLQISATISQLAQEARDGSLAVEHLRGGTFTITNVGAIGGTGMVATINYPEVAILGLPRAQPKPVVRNGQIVVRTMLPLTLCFDHRVCDGADAARFVNRLVHLLEDPQRLLLEA